MDNMDNMLKAIIEMDSSARLRESETEEYREEALKNLAEQKKTLLEQEEARVEDTVAKYGERVKTQLEKKISELSEDEERISAALNEKFENKRDAWVDALVARVLAETEG